MGLGYMVACLFVFLLVAVGVNAKERRTVIFRLDPPGAKVYLKETNRSSFQKEMGRANEGVLIEGSQDQFEFVLAADGCLNTTIRLTDSEIPVDKTTYWPAVDQVHYLTTQDLTAKLGQIWRRFTWLIVGLGSAFLALSVHFAITRWKQIKNAKRRARIAALGGNADVIPMGPYILLNRVGAGGFGEVYRAIHISQLFVRDPIFVAIKTILPHLLDSSSHLEKPSTPTKKRTPDEEKVALEQQKEREKRAKVTAESFFKRFKLEAALLWELDHPNIVKLISYEFNWDPPYIVMEFIDGESLDRILERYPDGMSPVEALATLEGGLTAIAFVHGQDPTIIHKDLKPSNLMIRTNKEMVVMDFGIANRQGDDRLTSMNDGVFEPVGSPHYMAIERIQEPELQLAASDQFSLGAILFEMVTGKPSFSSGSDLYNGKLPKVMEVKPELGRFGEVIDRMRSHNYEDRFESVAAAHEALKQALA